MIYSLVRRGVMEKKLQKTRKLSEEELELMAIDELKGYIPELKEEMNYTSIEMKDIFNEFCSYLSYTQEIKSDRFKRMENAYKDVLHRITRFGEKLKNSSQIKDKDLYSEVFNGILDIHSKLESLLFLHLSKAKIYAPLCEDIKPILGSNEYMIEQVFGVGFFFCTNRHKIYNYQRCYVDCKAVENYEGDENGVPLPDGYSSSCVHKGVWLYNERKKKYDVLGKEIVKIDRDEKFNDVLLESDDEEERDRNN